jgi:hypothetical protein
MVEAKTLDSEATDSLLEQPYEIKRLFTLTPMSPDEELRLREMPRSHWEPPVMPKSTRIASRKAIGG